MKMHKLILTSLFTATVGMAQAAEVKQVDSLDELLKTIKAAERTESRENAQRIQRFKNDRNQQQRLLNEAKAELAREEARSEELKKTYDTNEVQLGEFTERLRIKLGNLGEAIGVVRQVSADAAATIDTSIVSAQYPGRQQTLLELAARKEIPTIPELRSLWVALQTEMNEQGKIVTFDGEMLDQSGRSVVKPITRIGTFNLIVDDEFVVYNLGSKNVEALPKQPKEPSGVMGVVSSYASSGGKFALFPIDPSHGNIVEREKDREDWLERFEAHAGIVGWAIVVVLIIGFIIALERLGVLSATGAKMRKQAKSSTPGNNPLGRVMSVYLANKDDSFENLELKLDEAVLKELPRLETRIAIIKIFAAVSPLMGLLGTVTGMIETFQGITLYGAGDTSVMAGGISSALITTVLGIVAAIPLILLHAFVSAKSKTLVHMLEEQSSGLIAQHVEGK
ncbi:MotA/TolQ/ExbB proton channel family protein [Pleionea litopenaei]|uniref:MotA/TolQ/ExbB proton channel family protein n=1 Tax=Pleionea litopenaei TaxID=3070815 RepID=A0AA51RVT0_9GAMM|nr:MotA/TolQ/ExbB proton channel family protein [Pleionea sp. HL-JVS1]WMS88561.1 MotA/TolQ/ExbB proton channel family protein [Pleionea sp. HL-JVS1]